MAGDAPSTDSGSPRTGDVVVFNGEQNRRSEWATFWYVDGPTAWGGPGRRIEVTSISGGHARSASMLVADVEVVHHIADDARVTVSFSRWTTRGSADGLQQREFDELWPWMGHRPGSIQYEVDRGNFGDTPQYAAAAMRYMAGYPDPMALPATALRWHGTGSMDRGFEFVFFPDGQLVAYPKSDPTVFGRTHGLTPGEQAENMELHEITAADLAAFRSVPLRARSGVTAARPGTVTLPGA